MNLIQMNLEFQTVNKKEKDKTKTKKASLDYKTVKPSKVKELQIFVLQ